MSFPDDKRAVSQVIGALLIFAFLVITFSGYQATIVPDQNAEIEFSHSQQVESDFVGIRNAVLNARDRETQSQQIPLSVRYPSRAIAVNAGPASGSLQTTELGEYELTGAGTTPADVCRLPSGPVTTQRLSFTPNYNYFDGAPGRFSYGNSVAYRNFPSAKRVDTTQTLVQGSTVRIRPLSGEVQQSRDGAVSVTATAGITTTEELAPPGSNREVQLRVPSDLSDTDWKSETDIESSPIVDDIRNYSNGIELELREAGSGITLACTPVGLDAAPPDQTTPTPTSASVPTDAVAFNDTDGDQEYDQNEAAYTASEAAKLYKSVDLVIEKDIDVKEIQMKPRSVLIKRGVELATKNKLKIETSDKIEIQDATLDSDNKITLKSSSGGITGQDATFSSKNGMKITADGGGLDVTGSSLTSKNELTLSASGEITGQDAIFSSENNKIEATANNGTLNLRGGSITSDNKITLTSTADIDLRDAKLQAKNKIKATPASLGALLVNDNGPTDGGTYIEDQNGNPAEIALQQGTQDGRPEKGSITQ